MNHVSRDLTPYERFAEAMRRIVSVPTKTEVERRARAERKRRRKKRTR